MEDNIISDLLESNDPDNWYIALAGLSSMKDDVRDVENEMFIRFITNHSTTDSETYINIIKFIESNFESKMYADLYRTYSRGSSNKKYNNNHSSIYKKNKGWK